MNQVKHKKNNIHQTNHSTNNVAKSTEAQINANWSLGGNWLAHIYLLYAKAGIEKLKNAIRIGVIDVFHGK